MLVETESNTIELSDTLVNSRQLVNNAVGSGVRTRLELEMSAVWQMLTRRGRSGRMYNSVFPGWPDAAQSSLFKWNMGLDGVELVMDVEDHFGIAIPDAGRERIRTVGDLVFLIHDRISAARSAYCPTLHGFFSLRNVVREITGDSSLRLRPRHAVIDVLNPSQRLLLWARLPQLLGTLPLELRRPPALRMVLGCGVLILFVLAVATAASGGMSTLLLVLGLAALVTYAVHRVTIRFRTVPPKGLDHIRRHNH